MSTITNTPIKRLQDYTFDEIGSMSVEQLAGVPMSRQFTPVTNTSKVSFAELWSTITTTWASETRTWLDCASIIENTTIGSTDTFFSSRTFPFLQTLPFSLVGGITNVAKP